jgi:ubiquinone/menaquinone biosynthesis C-methylase UbiE
MTVSMEKTSRKYRGRKAATYEAVRQKQRRWSLENRAVEKLLPANTMSVLDCPVGTGRFLPLYADRGIPTVHGVDVSDEMLDLARHKVARAMRTYKLIGKVKPQIVLERGYADALRWGDRNMDVAVCVRFLDLIEEASMRQVVREMCRIARRAVILTIRLGDSYVPRVNTATHGRADFNRLVKNLGWCVEEKIPIGTDRGTGQWTVMKLGRRP